MAKKKVSSSEAKSAMKTVLNYSGQQAKKGAIAAKEGVQSAAKKAKPHIAKAKNKFLSWYGTL